MRHRIDPDLTRRARELRSNPTPTDQHAEQAKADDRRTRFLQRKGWRIIRLWNSNVLANPEGAVLHILAEAAECLGGTHPQPLPGREGRSKDSRRR